jgi:hypothetical protein
VVDHDGIRQQHDPAAGRPQPHAQLHRGGVEIVVRRQPTDGRVRCPIHDQRRTRARGDVDGRAAGPGDGTRIE